MSKYDKIMYAKNSVVVNSWLKIIRYTQHSVKQNITPILQVFIHMNNTQSQTKLTEILVTNNK